MDAVAACGTSFAFPSQTLYLGRDAAAAEVKEPPPTVARAPWSVEALQPQQEDGR